MSEQTKPNDNFWYVCPGVLFHASNVSKPSDSDIAVVEKKAFDAQALEIEKLLAAIEWLKMTHKLDLEKLKDELEFVTKNRDDIRDAANDFSREYNKMKSRVEKLKGALKFYAQNEHWQSVSVNGLAFNATFELGEKAREALIEDAKLESESGE